MSEHDGRGQGHQTSAQVVEQPTREEGIVRAGSTPVEHERPEDWGWHHAWGSKMRWAIIIPVVFVVAMIWGNHQGKTEDIWLIGSAVVMVLLVIWDARRRKKLWRPN